MMNINEMTDQEKSVMLVRLCGWKHSENAILIYEDRKTVWGYYNGQYGTFWYGDYPDLYDRANMALAWLVLGWGMNHDAIKGELIYAWLSWEIYDMQPADAQRAWLDKILELAIAAGLVEAGE